MATKTKVPYVKVKFTFDGVLPVEHYDKSGMNLNSLVLDAIKKKSDDCFATIGKMPNALWTSSKYESKDEEYPFKVRLKHRPIEKKEKEHVNNPIKIAADCQNILNEVVKKYGDDPHLEKMVDDLWEECFSNNKKK